MTTGPDLTACTIIAKNYLAQARALSRSFRDHHPEASVLVLVLDDTAGYVDPQQEPFTVIRLHELGLPDAPTLAFQYSLLELATAVKPFLLEHIFERYGVRKLLYLDPDVWVLDSLVPLSEILAERSIALTPHITDPIDDDLLPSELTFLQCGAYNLGFLGLADTPTTRRMLTWWQKRCVEHCVIRLDRGLFVDQKWMDLVPAIFKDVAIVGDPGYNVAYWNLHGRQVSKEGTRWRVNGQPLRFFHFSGYDPELPHAMSKHQTRFALGQLGPCQDLFDQYRALLLKEGYQDTVRWPYSFATFDNEVRVSPIIRHLYLGLGAARREFGDPFSTRGARPFFDWLNAPARGERAEPPYVSNLLAHIGAFRADVRERYPDRRGRQRRDFLEWVRSAGGWQLELDERFLAPASERPRSSTRSPVPSVAGVVRALHGASCRVCPIVPLLDHYGYGARVRAFAQHYLQSPDAEAPWSMSPLTEGPRSSPLRRAAAWLAAKSLRPCDRHHLLASLIGNGTGIVPVARAGAAEAAAGDPLGVNLAGYLTTESGVGEAARLVARSLQTAGVPHVLINFEVSYNLRRGDRTFTTFSSRNPHGINLVHVNADQVPVFAEHYGREFFEDRYNIGFWMWELSDFPAEWADRFGWFDEIWTPSAFTSQAVAQRSSVPVWTSPLPVPESPDPHLDRGHFGLSLDRFVFLFMFDFASVFARKNPLDVVAAFQRAFRSDDRVQLVLKCANGDADPRNAERLRDACRGESILLLEKSMSREEVVALVSAADAYVSLHRSEGFGLTMAEAMSVGKPVIATGYSGNLEFMNSRNSFLVPYRLVEVGSDGGPYPAASLWAAPDVAQAADLMRWVLENRAAAEEVGARGRKDVATHLSPEAVGDVVRRRLRQGAGSVNGKPAGTG